ncbi:MAG: urease accessory protein UreF [Hyphomicrobium sp.]
MTWLSPAFPVGAYSYSHGIEAAVEAGLVEDRASLADWIEAILAHGTGRTDAVFVAASIRAAESDDPAVLDRVAERAAAYRATAELAFESAAEGAAFLQAVRAAWPHPLLDALAARLTDSGPGPGVPSTLAYPVAVGVAAAAWGVPEDLTVAAYLQAFSSNLVSAGLRLIPLGQTDGLKVLASVEPVIHAVAQEALGLPMDAIGSATLMVEWTSMRHETQYARLFRS